MGITRASQKGQVVIPQEIRDELGLKEGDVVEIDQVDKLIVVKKLKLPSLREELAKSKR